MHNMFRPQYGPSSGAYNYTDKSYNKPRYTLWIHRVMGYCDMTAESSNHETVADGRC
jgi:hypothetical protein